MADETLHNQDPKFLDGYEILGRLGEGASGVVYRAKQSDGTFVALKVLRAELANDAKVRERLRREATALQRVVGGRTAKVLKVEPDASIPYLVMELVPGTNLDEFVQKNGPLRGGLLWSATLGLVEALASIHEAGVIHRDLKPSNILIGADGIKVVDFGVSALHEASSLTGTGVFIGTASWVSPEQVTGSAVTEASDVFSLGMVLAYASSGSHPFGSGRTDAVMYRITHESPNLFGVPEGIRPIIEGCLNKSPLLRPSLHVVKTLLNDSVFSGGAEDPLGDGTKVIGQTVIEAGLQRSKPKAEDVSSAKAGISLFKKNLKAGVASVLALGVIAAVLVVRSNGDTSSIEGADAINSDSAETIQEPIDVFATLAESFVSKSSTTMNAKLGFGLEEWTIKVGEERSQIWGTQLDCSNYYPLYDLGFGDSSTTIKSGSTYQTGDGSSGAYIIDYRFFTGFNGDPMNFTRRAAVVESKFQGCQDKDYYPSADVEIGPCLSRLFKDEATAFPKLDETCAKDALRSWKYQADARNTKVGFYPDTPGNGRIGTQYIFSTEPTGEAQCCATTQWATAIVWEQENVGLILTVAGYEPTGKNVKFSLLGDNALTFLTSLTDVANKMVIEAFGS